MRRTSALQGLSRDHHRTLVVALRLKRVNPEDAIEGTRELLEFWHTRERLHLELEEEVLAPAIERSARSSELEAALARMHVEHVLIRGRVAELEGDGGDSAALHALGTRLADHVRFEEHVLFPLIEQELPPGRLEELAKGLGSNAGTE